MTDFQGPRCETCRFFFVDGGQTVCRRYPPTLTVFETKRTHGNVGDGLEGLAYSAKSIFPPMLPSGWCGEWSSAT